MSEEQKRYQVRFDFGLAGAHAIASDADVLVWVDASADADVPLEELPATATVIAANLPAAQAVATWIVERQLALGKRITIALVAANADRTGSSRYAVEDQLAAGAIIDHLAALGLDATSPEAAVAEAAYRGLSRATGHLYSASVSAQERVFAQGLDRVDASLSSADVVVLRTPTP